MKFKKTLAALLAGLMMVSAIPAVSAAEENETDPVTETVTEEPVTTEEPTDTEEPVTVKVSKPKIKSLKNDAKGITVKWAATKGAAKYVVYAKKAKGSFKKVKELDATKTSYTYTSVKSGTKYTFKLKAQNDISKAQSKQKTLLRVGTSKLTTSNSADAIKVTWKKVAGATKYVLQYKKPSAKKYSTAYKGKKTSYKDDNFGSGTTYQFRVKAQIKSVSGAYSAVKTQIFLESPSINANESPFDMSGINVTWSKVKGAKGYLVYRKTKYGKDAYKKIAKVEGADKINYFDKELESIESYKYYVKAYSGSYKSAKSNVVWEVYGKYVDDATPFKLTIKKGQTYKDISKKLDSYGVLNLMYFWSDNPNIATVDQKAVIKGIKKGKVVMHARGAYKGQNHKVTLVVNVK